MAPAKRGLGLYLSPDNPACGARTAIRRSDLLTMNKVCWTQTDGLVPKMLPKT